MMNIRYCMGIIMAGLWVIITIYAHEVDPLNQLFPSSSYAKIMDTCAYIYEDLTIWNNALEDDQTEEAQTMKIMCIDLLVAKLHNIYHELALLFEQRTRIVHEDLTYLATLLTNIAHASQPLVKELDRISMSTIEELFDDIQLSIKQMMVTHELL